MLIAPHTLDLATDEAIRRGIKVLQGCRFAATDEDHVSVLLTYMAPSYGAAILDVGCGFGEVARLMGRKRPDLDFILLNQNEKQLAYAPAYFRHFVGDMHAIPLADNSVDGAMFLYSLCHADFDVALTEAARVTRPGGELFVYDYERTGGDNALFLSHLSAWAIPRYLMEWVAGRAGWAPVMHETPLGDDTMFRDAFSDDVTYDAIFRDLTPCVWKMRLQ